MLELYTSDEALLAPPAQDEIEVTVIGPGFGESALVHVGDNNWLIIDSCKAPSGTIPAPLQYLADIGVNPDRVFAIVVTHWDEDHCKGISQVVDACAAAEIIMSKAFVERDFLTFVSTYERPLTSNLRSNVKEIAAIARTIAAAERPVTDAYPDRRIRSARAMEMSHGAPVEIWTLSPSDREYQNFLDWTASQMPLGEETRRVAVKRIRNDLSVVLHVSVGTDVMLFGGDLEEEGRPDTGWSAILASTGRPAEKANLFKVAHHGSATGHHESLPADLLATEPIAIVAPFKNGNVSLPTIADVARIRAYAPKSYATATLQGRGNPRRHPVAEKTIREVTKNFSTVKTTPGLVRLRKRVTGEKTWRADLFGSACPLQRIH